MAENAESSVIIPVDMSTTKAEKKLQELAKKINGFERDIQTNENKKLPLQKRLDELTVAADEAAKKLDDMKNAPIGAYTKGQIARQTETVRALGAQWDAVQREVAGYERKIANTTEKLNAAKEEYGKLAVEGAEEAEIERYAAIMEQTKSRMQKIASGITGAFKTVGSKISSIFKGAAKTLGAFTKKVFSSAKNLNVFSKISEKLSGVMKKLGRTIKSALVFSVIYKGLSLVKEQVASYLSVNKEFSAALSQIKSALLTAFQPIYDVVVPALTTLLNTLTSVISSITQFVSALFGTTAKQAQKNASALYDQAKATEEAGSAADDAAGSLASFDEINTLSSGKSSGAASTSEPTFDLALDDTVFDSWGQAFDSFLDNILNQGLPRLSSAFDAISKKINSFSAKLLEMFTFPGVLEKVKTIGTSVAAAFNNLVASINWNQLGQAIGAGLNLAIAFAVAFLYSVDWINLGASFADFVNGIVAQIDWYDFGKLLFSGFKIGIETLAGFIIGLDMAQIGQAASSVVIGFANSVTETLAKIDWKKIGEQVKTFLVNIDWSNVASATFEAIGTAFGALTAFLWGLIQDAWKEVVNWWHDVAFEDGQFTMQGLLEGIWEVIKSIGTWIKEHIFQPFINGFKKVFGIHSPSTVMKEQGNFIMEGLLNGIEEKVDAVIQTVKKVFNGITDFVKNVFSGDWKNAWNSIASVFKNIWNGIIGSLEGAVNLIIQGINWLIKQLNKVSFSIPDWVPAIGGKKFGFNIPSVSEISIPRLATGAVIPPNREFLAVLGDQKSGTNIEAPLSTIEQAVENVLNRRGDSENVVKVALYLDGKELARNQVKHINTMTKANGKPVILV